MELMVAGFVAVIAIPALLVGSLIFADKLASERYRFSVGMLLVAMTLAAMACWLLSCLLR